MCGAAVVQAYAATVRDAGDATEVFCCTVLSGSSVCLALDYLPQQAAAHMVLLGWLACVWQRPPDGWTSTPRASRRATAETTPKALLLLVWTGLSRLLAADWKTTLLVPGPWLWDRVRLRIEVSCVLACLSALPLLGVHLLAYATGTLMGPPRPSACPSACLLPSAFLRTLPFPPSVLSPSPAHVPGNPDKCN